MREATSQRESIIMIDDYVEKPPGYSLEKVIGRGTFSECWLARHELTGCRVAIKKVPRSADLQLLEREVTTWMRMDHPNIIQLFEVIPLHDFTYLAIEFADDGELFKLLSNHPNGLPQHMAISIFAQVCHAVNYLHSNNIAHRDLKLENIMMSCDQTQAKIGDFGFACAWGNVRGLCREWLGSPEYSAPELLSNEPYDPTRADCWSLGIILYALLTGYLPFSGVEDDCSGISDVERKIRYRVLNRQYEIPEHIPKDLTDLIQGLLNYDIQQRWDTNRVMAHPKIRASHKISDPFPVSSIPERLIVSELRGLEVLQTSKRPGPAMALKRILQRNAEDYPQAQATFNTEVQSSRTTPELTDIDINIEQTAKKSGGGGWMKTLNFLSWPKKYRNVGNQSHSDTSDDVTITTG